MIHSEFNPTCKISSHEDPPRTNINLQLKLQPSPSLRYTPSLVCGLFNMHRAKVFHIRCFMENCNI